MKQTKGRIADRWLLGRCGFSSREQILGLFPHIQLERVNGIRWRLCLVEATQCSREIELILETAPLGLDPNPFGWVILLLYDRRHLDWKFCLDYANIKRSFPKFGIVT
ncbi:hypothetical protein H5410_003357, partial [Solanum commersonii]